MKLARNFRESARNSLRGKWGISVIATVIASMLGGNLFDLDFNITYEEEGEQIVVTNPEFFEQLYAILLLSLPYILLTTFIALVIGSTVKVGHAKFYLDLLDAYPPVDRNALLLFQTLGYRCTDRALKVRNNILWHYPLPRPGYYRGLFVIDDALYNCGKRWDKGH